MRLDLTPYPPTCGQCRRRQKRQCLALPGLQDPAAGHPHREALAYPWHWIPPQRTIVNVDEASSNSSKLADRECDVSFGARRDAVDGALDDVDLQLLLLWESSSWWDNRVDRRHRGWRVDWRGVGPRRRVPRGGSRRIGARRWGGVRGGGIVVGGSTPLLWRGRELSDSCRRRGVGNGPAAAAHDDAQNAPFWLLDVELGAFVDLVANEEAFLHSRPRVLSAPDDAQQHAGAKARKLIEQTRQEYRWLTW
jgi:hypothetical protein